MNSGIIILDRNMDWEQTVKNGMEICRTYRPLVQERLKAKMHLPMHSGSLIQVSSDIPSGNGLEHEYLKRIAQEGDQVESFLRLLDRITEIDERTGRILKYHLIDEMSDEEIAKKLNISRRTLYPSKKKGYVFIANWANKVEYIHEKIYSVTICYPELYDLL